MRKSNRWSAIARRMESRCSSSQVGMRMGLLNLTSGRRHHTGRPGHMRGQSTRELHVIVQVQSRTIRRNVETTGRSTGRRLFLLRIEVFVTKDARPRSFVRSFTLFNRHIFSTFGGDSFRVAIVAGGTSSTAGRITAHNFEACARRICRGRRRRQVRRSCVELDAIAKLMLRAIREEHTRQARICGSGNSDDMREAVELMVEMELVCTAAHQQSLISVHWRKV